MFHRDYQFPEFPIKTFDVAVAIIPVAALTRSLPTTSNGDFSATYAAVNVGSDKWPVAIEDEIISGPCTFPNGGKTIKTFYSSEDGPTKTITITAPDDAVCVFGGKFQFSDGSATSFLEQTVTVANGGSGSIKTVTKAAPNIVQAGDTF